MEEEGKGEEGEEEEGDNVTGDHRVAPSDSWTRRRHNKLWFEGCGGRCATGTRCNFLSFYTTGGRGEF